MIKNDKTLNQTITVYDKIRSSILNAQRKIYAVVNSSIVESYWEIGEQIYKECGKSDRAEYGKSVLKYLSQQLTKEFGKGFGERELRRMRQFYLAFPIRAALRPELSWTHYRIIMRVDNPRARDFYLNECGKAGWSSRQLERQVNSFFYERILSSKDKESTAKEIEILEPKTEINFKDILKEPYILEFLNLSDSSKYHEKDIEQGLIDHLQKFLLELGRGVRHEVASKSCFRVSRKPSMLLDESRGMNKELSRQCNEMPLGIGKIPQGKFPSGNHNRVSC